MRNIFLKKTYLLYLSYLFDGVCVSQRICSSILYVFPIYLSIYLSIYLHVSTCLYWSISIALRALWNYHAGPAHGDDQVFDARDAVTGDDPRLNNRRSWDCSCAEHVGTLGLGREAYIAVLELVECDCMLEDVAGQLRHCSERLVPRAVWRAGLAHGVTQVNPHTVLVWRFKYYLGIPSYRICVWSAWLFDCMRYSTSTTAAHVYALQHKATCDEGTRLCKVAKWPRCRLQGHHYQIPLTLTCYKYSVIQYMYAHTGLTIELSNGYTRYQYLVSTVPLSSARRVAWPSYQLLRCLC